MRPACPCVNTMAILCVWCRSCQQIGPSARTWIDQAIFTPRLENFPIQTSPIALTNQRVRSLADISRNAQPSQVHHQLFHIGVARPHRVEILNAQNLLTASSMDGQIRKQSDPDIAQMHSPRRARRKTSDHESVKHPCIKSFKQASCCSSHCPCSIASLAHFLQRRSGARLFAFSREKVRKDAPVFQSLTNLEPMIVVAWFRVRSF